MHSQESGPTSQGGSKLDPPSFFSLAFAVGVICFPVGVQPPQPPANFYPGSNPISRIIEYAKKKLLKFLYYYYFIFFVLVILILLQFDQKSIIVRY